MGRSRPERDGRGNRDDLAVFIAHDLPTALMHHPMMTVAEQDQVAEDGLTAFDPVLEVVAVAERCRPAATRPLAVPVTKPERLFQRAGDDAPRPAHIDRHGVLAQKYARHAAVQGHALHGARG